MTGGGGEVPKLSRPPTNGNRGKKKSRVELPMLFFPGCKNYR